MRVVCLDRTGLEKLRKLGAPVKDLTPTGLGDSRFHLVTMEPQQVEALREFGITHEDVTPKAIRAVPESGFMYCRGGKIPNGQRLRTSHKGKPTEAVVSKGYIMIGGRGYDSPSAAARGAGHGIVDGWRVWEFLDDDGEWKPLKVLRSRNAA